MSIRDNWLSFHDSLENTAEKYGRETSSITVMAVSKTRGADEIVEARHAGLSSFGENRIEEASEKFAALDPLKFPLYMIGHVQSNKVNGINTRFTGVHSVDSIKIAHRLSRYRESIGSDLQILLQVNTSGEDSKSGIRDSVQLAEIAAEISELPYLKLQGLMTMAPFVGDESVVRKCFEKCRNWSDRIAHLISGEITLSMGMSSDYQWAIAEGSTLLRIGTTIFGSAR